MIERIEKSLTDLDFSAVDFESGCWSFSRGGHPNEDDEWSISFYSAGLVETRYKFPKFLNKFVHDQYRFGVKDAQNKIQSALGL